jgi:hypothetical protein
MPATFNSLGISFQYPDNWTLEDTDAVAGRRSVTVYSPGGAFWSLAIHPRSADPSRLAEGVVTAMKEEYADLEVQETHERLAGHETVGYDLNFYCLDLTNSAQIRAVRVGQGTYTIFCQAEDQEFEQIQRVFQAITNSLLRGLKDLGCRR